MKNTRILSWLLVVAMVLSMLPTFAFADDSATVWTKVEFVDIKATDTVAITMTSGEETYVLPTVGLGSSEQPLGDLATVSGNTLTTAGDSSAYGWQITAAEGGYYIKCGENYLYITATNNGVRIGETECVWNLIDDGYLTATDSNDTARYLGVYTKAPDWRCYKTYDSGNIAGQSVSFWVLDPSGTPVDPTEPTEPSAPTEPTEPSEPTEPTEPSEPIEPSEPAEGAVLLTELENGAKVYVYNPKNKAVLSAIANGTQLTAIAAEVEENYLTVTDEMEALTVVIDADGFYSFLNGAGEYLTYGGANVLTFEASESDNSLWTVETTETGAYVKCVNAENLALEYYKSNFTVYSFQSYNTGAYLMQFFSAGTAGGFTDKLTAGDQVVIFNPTNSMALSTTIQNVEKNYDFIGTEVVESDGELSGYTDENVWTVGENEDGTFTFTSKDGQKLAVVNRTHIGFAEEGTAWTLELIDGKTDEFFVRSEVSTYLEYYTKDARWAAYYNPTEDMYAMRFYVIGGNVQPSNVVATPKATVKAGVVNSGTEIGFTCKTEGATILYKTTGEWTEYTAPIAITEDTTFTVKAVKEGMEDSKEITVSYTIYVPPTLGENQAQLVTDVSELSSGDQIIIVTKDYDYSLGVTQKANNRDYGTVIKAYDRCSYDEGTQIITLESGVEEGTFALYATNGGFPGYLYASSESGNLLRTQEGKDTNASFTITIAADGEAAITSKIDKKSNTIRYNTQGIFSCYGATGQKPVCIYKLDGQEKPGLPEDGDVVVIYNQSAKGVIADYGTVQGNQAVMAADAMIVDGKAVCDNGAFLFKVEKDGEYYRFYNETVGYLVCTSSEEFCVGYAMAEDAADWQKNWILEEFNGGYRMIQSAEDKGMMQYCADGAFNLCSDATVTDKDIATFHFYPCGNESVTEGVINEPRAVFGNLAMAYAGKDYSLSFTIESVFGVKELKVMLGETELEYKYSNDRYTAIIPAAMIVGESLTVRVIGLDNKDVAIDSSVEIIVNDEPIITDVQPIANTQTKENKRPVISAKLTNVGENPTISMTLNGKEVLPTYENGTVSYQPTEDLADGRLTIILTVTREDGKSISKKWSITIGESDYTLLFGQLHSHTGEYSDGNGTLASALDYIANLPESANVDFVAFTDHSNYFDKSGEANPEQALYDLSLATPYAQERWSTYKNTIAEFNKTTEGVIAVAGFEMTWSGGPGHMNTFVTDGIVSRNNTTLNNKSGDAGMRAYYQLLAQPEGVDSITQLNHPGGTFGNFSDFAYYDPVVDTRVYLVEVGNGEGPVNGSGYYPSYEQYTLALDKGWHIAPTNNQDNHKGKWGNGNDARDVVLAESFTEEGIYEAIRNYRVYATEDKNLEIMYTVNELPLGTIIENVPETLLFEISLMDPDATDSIVKVELIVNSGKVAYTWDNAEEIASGKLTANLKPEYSYYYVRVTQADKDVAVTAPVWVGDSLKLGLEEAKADTTSPVVGEELTISTTLYNRETSDALVKSVIYTTNGSEVLYVDNNTYVLAADGTVDLQWKYTPAAAKLTTINITVIVEYEGKEYTFTASVELDILNADEIAYFAIDASHNNEYVSGYNKDLLTAFIAMAEASAVRIELIETSEEFKLVCRDEKYSAILLNVPSRRISTALDYTEDELEALAEFNANGGMVIVTGSGDSNDKIEPHMAATQNKVLEALGSSIRLADDGMYEGDDASIYSLSFGMFSSHALTAGLNGSNLELSYYGGSSLYLVDADGNPVDKFPQTVTPILFANSNTVSKDGDSDGLGGDTPTYSLDRLLAMAVEESEGKGMIFVAGAAFMNDYDLEEGSANYVLCRNLLKAVHPVKITNISEVRAQSEAGYKFTIEGIVTSNASGYDKETAFFDCIYVQDGTAGINCFPIAGEYQLGDIVRITGTTDFYQGEPELQVISIELIGKGTPVKPIEITAAQLNSRDYEGMLVNVDGYVTLITMANGLVESIYVRDESGDIARVFIDGYITADKTIENLEVGCFVSATGLASYDDTYAIENKSYARIRVRDRAEIIATPHEHSYEDGVCTGCGAADPEYVPSFPFVDVPEDQWYRKAIEYVYRMGLMNGMSADTFEPESKLTRAMLVTILYRMNGAPEVDGENIFVDIAEGQWYTDAVIWASTNGITNGMSADEFMPDLNVTREQMVTFLYRYAKYFATNAETVNDLSAFKDADKVSDFAVEAMSWAVGWGIVNGVSADELDPQGEATRAQVAKVIMEFITVVFEPQA